MDIYLKRASPSDKVAIRNLLQLHLHDLSTIAGVDACVGGMDVDESGLYDYHNFDLCWIDERGFPYLIAADGKIAGFALVYKHLEIRFSIVEFFILRKYRRKGVGTYAALRILESFQGECDITVSDENKPAVQFWQNVARQYSSSKHRIILVEHGDWKGMVLHIEP